MKIAKEISGKSQLVICLPGFLEKSDSYLFLVEQFKSKCDFLLVDYQLTEESTYLNLVEKVSKLIREYSSGYPRIILLGYSLGARLALSVYLKKQVRLDTLILESLNPGIVNLDARKDRQAKDLMLAKSIREKGLKLFLNSWYDNPIFKNPTVTKEQMISESSGYDPEQAALILEKLSPGLMPEMWSQLEKIEAEVLLINGENDQVFLNYAREVQKIINCQLEVVKSAGHNIHSYHPEVYASKMIALCRDSGSNKKNC